MLFQFHDKTVLKLSSAMSIVMLSARLTIFVDLITNFTSLSVTCEKKIVESTFSLSQSNVASPPSNSKVALQYALLNTSRYAEVMENHTLMNASLHKNAVEREILSQKHTWDHVADQRSHPPTIYIRQLIYLLKFLSRYNF